MLEIKPVPRPFSLMLHNADPILAISYTRGTCPRDVHYVINLLKGLTESHHK